MSELCVWDASAVLALLNREEGWQRLLPALSNGLLSSVNLSEVVAKLAERGLPESAIEEVLSALPFEIRPFTRDTALIAGLLRPATRSSGLSLGDRACLALATQAGSPALTADRSWSAIDVGVEIRLVR